MNSRDRYPERIPRRYVEQPQMVRASQWKDPKSRAPRQSTKALTAKVAMLAVVATLAIGGLIAAQMAAGSDPALGPKAADRANKAATSKAASGSSASGSATDPYGQAYGDDGYYGSSSGYSSGSGGASGSSGYSYAPPPVTSSTS